MKDINCPCCGKNIITEKKLKDADRWDNYGGFAWLLVASGPIGYGLGALCLGTKAYKKHIQNEVDVKCPHCKKKITLTKEQWKEIKKLVKEVRDNERHKTQNRL